MGRGSWRWEMGLKSQIENAGEENTGRRRWMEEKGLKTQIKNAWEDIMGIHGWRVDGRIEIAD